MNSNMVQAAPCQKKKKKKKKTPQPPANLGAKEVS